MNTYSKAVDFFKSKQINESNKSSNLILAAYELRTPENLGALIRLASNLGIEKVLFIQNENKFKTSKIARVAHSGLKHVNYSFCTSEDFFSLIPEDFDIVAVETSKNSTNLFTTVLPEKCILLLGNERYGIDQEFLNRVSKTVFIPLIGKTLSMNVSHAAALAAFEWGRQHLDLDQI